MVRWLPAAVLERWRPAAVLVVVALPPGALGLTDTCPGNINSGLACPAPRLDGVMARCWGVPESGGDCEGVALSGTTAIAAGGTSFVAVDAARATTRCWGNGPDCPASLPLRNASELYSNKCSFLAVDRSAGKGYCWGSSYSCSMGEGSPNCSGIDFPSSVVVRNTDTAFVALDTASARGSCWGHPVHGGSCAGVNFSGVRDVFRTDWAFLALDRHASRGECWGHPGYGGLCSHIDFSGVTDIYSTQRAFLALDKRTGRAQCWGPVDYGGNCSGMNLSWATDVFRTDLAFMAVNVRTGQALCWGRETHGGKCDGFNFSGYTEVFNNYGAFVALNRDAGRGHCWGASWHGGRCPGVDFTGVTRIFSTDSAFLALDDGSGRAECWGSRSRGNQEVCRDTDFKGVVGIYGTYQAFVAVWPAVVAPGAMYQVDDRLFWTLVATAVASLIACAGCLLSWLHKTRAWPTGGPPFTGGVFKDVLRLRSQLPGAPLRKALRLEERIASLLAGPAARAAGGPPFWSISVEQLVAFHAETQSRMEAYCRDHLIDGEFAHVCRRQPCPHDHGDARHHASSHNELREVPQDMHTMVDVIIRPATKEHEGILGFWSTLNLESPRRAEVFVSHCWNEKFGDFVSTLGTLRPELSVWVCSFALPQNIDISRVLSNRPDRSPFAAALRSAERVLLAVDDRLEPLTRSWCCFELYLAVTYGKRIDIRAHVQSVSLYKAMQQKAGGIDIRDCRASHKADHERIMASIRGKEDAVNVTIRHHLEETANLMQQVVP